MAIHVVYPKKDHCTFEAATFIMGQITDFNPTTDTLLIQNDTIIVNQHGFFSHKVNLKTGTQEFLLQHQRQQSTLSTFVISILCEPPQPVLSDSPPSVNTTTIKLWRQTGNVTLMAGDTLPIELLASPGCQVNINVNQQSVPITSIPVTLTPLDKEGSTKDTYIDNRTIVFQEPHQTSPMIPVHGYYQGILNIPASFEKETENIPLTITIKNSAEEIVIVETEQTCSIWQTPRMGVVTAKKAITRIEPNTEADRLTEQPEGTIVKLTGKVGDWYRCQLTDSDQFWIDANAVEILAIYAVQDKTLDSIELINNQLKFDLSEAVPIEIESDGPWLRVRFFQVQDNTNFSDPTQFTYPEGLSDLQVDTPRDEVMEISLRVNRLCGYDYCYENEQFIINIYQLPKTIEETRILIDPGHGGEEDGAIGLDGTPEKELNLTIGKKLQESLSQAGFQVALSRSEDKTLSLQDRQAFVAEFLPHITLSLHHNALPDGRDPSEHQGCCTFWYHSHSVDLADVLQDGLSQNCELNDYGVFYESFVITRPTQTMAVLLEIGFFTHPDEYARLIEPDFQASVVENITNSMSNFVTNL